MENPCHLDKFSLKRRNIIKYGGIQPSVKLMLKIVKNSGLETRMNFSRVWGIRGQVLNQYKNGDRNLPPQYWHIFYEYDTMKKVLAKKIENSKNETIFGSLEEPKKQVYKPAPILNKKLIDDQIRF